MSQSTLRTSAVDVRSLPFGALEAVWTGSPTGTFSVDASLDGTTWYPTGTTVNSPAGGADSTLINLSGMGFCYVSLKYTRTGGTGSLTVTAYGKAGGGS